MALFDLVVINTGYTYRLLSDNISIFTNEKNLNNYFIKNNIELMYIADAKYMVEFYGDQTDERFFKSLELTITEGVGIKNATLGQVVNVFEKINFCAISNISHLEIYEHIFEGKTYKIVNLTSKNNNKYYCTNKTAV